MALVAAASSFCPVSYDYIIAGGGTAGLVLATRLSENPGVSVAVIEAGGDHTDDPKVLTPGLAMSMGGDPEYDWNYQTAPQENLSGQVFALTRGKQLGGSSAVNYMDWTHASQEDINDWGKLGNDGWSWDSLFPYYFKSENSITPTAKIAEDLKITPKNYVPVYHGKNGPIQNSFPDFSTSFDKAWPKTCDALGIGWNGDPKNGLAIGGGSHPRIQGLNKTRSYSGNAYWKPVSSRPNLKTFTYGHVSRVLFNEKGTDNDLTATGVEFLAGGQTFIVRAKQEVILSAGTIGSPQILELSGIGSPRVIKSLNKKVLIENFNVGENLQDHTFIPLSYEAIDGLYTAEDLADPMKRQAALNQYNTDKTGPLTGGTCNEALLSYNQLSAPRPTTPLPRGINDPLLTPEEAARFPGRAENLALTKRKLLNPKEAVTQTVPIAGSLGPVNGSGHYLSFLGALMHPFSRGSIHINSTDPLAYPVIDPKFFSHPLDVEVGAKIALHMQTFAKTAPFSSLLKGNGTVYQQGYYHLNEDNVRAFVKKFGRNEQHACGTCSMAPRNKGGVVDARLKVYGTKNLRVVDFSVAPLLIRGNPTSLIYAIAEKAADTIKEDSRG